MMNRSVLSLVWHSRLGGDALTVVGVLFRRGRQRLLRWVGGWKARLSAAAVFQNPARRIGAARIARTQLCGFRIAPTGSGLATGGPLPDQDPDRAIAAAWQLAIAERLFAHFAVEWLPGAYRALLDKRYASPVRAFEALVTALGLDPIRLRGPTSDLNEVQWLRNSISCLVEIEQWTRVPAEPFRRFLIVRLKQRRHDVLTLARIEQLVRIGATLEALLDAHDPDAAPPVITLAGHRAWREILAALAQGPEALFDLEMADCDAELSALVVDSDWHLRLEARLHAVMARIQVEAQQGIAQIADPRTQFTLRGMLSNAQGILEVLTKEPGADPQARIAALENLLLDLLDLLRLDAAPDPEEELATENQERFYGALAVLGFDPMEFDSLTLDAVRQGYRRLAGKHHPDRAKTEAERRDRTVMMCDLNTAWHRVQRLWPIILQKSTPRH